MVSSIDCQSGIPWRAIPTGPHKIPRFATVLPTYGLCTIDVNRLLLEQSAELMPVSRPCELHKIRYSATVFLWICAGFVLSLEE
jgi:hypothetical protein